MTTYDLGLVTGTAIDFDPATDVLTVGAAGSASEVTLTPSGSDLVLALGSDSVTLRGLTLAQVRAGAFTFTDGSVVYVGDNAATETDNADDTIALGGNDENNLVYGLGGDDAITVGNGDNVIFGGSAAADGSEGGTFGEDTIIAGTGSNTIYGNAGDDDITVGATVADKTVNLYGGAGDDEITSGAAHADSTASVAGGNDSDVIDFSASEGASTIYGGNGGADAGDAADTILGSQGSSKLYGNAGDDNIQINTGGVVTENTAYVHGGQGDDIIEGYVPGDADTEYTVYGGAGADLIDFSTSTAGDLDSATAFTGDATIYGGSGSVNANDGADTITSGTGSTVIYGNGGDDSLTVTGTASGKTAAVYGGQGDDTISVTLGHATAAATVSGGQGEDTLNVTAVAGSTVTLTDFNSDDDALNVTLSAGQGASHISHTLVGGTLTLESSVDAGAGDGGAIAAGDEVLVLQNFSGQINTGAGSTTINFAAGTGEFVYNVGGAAAVLGTYAGANDGGDLIVAGSNGDTLVAGIGGFDHLVGGAGADVFQLVAGGFNQFDTIAGGDGNDTIELVEDTTGGDQTASRADADFAGVTSVETLLVTADEDVAVINLSGGNLAQTAGIRTITADITKNVTVNLTGNNAGFTVTTGDGADTITASAGNDTITSGEGADDVVLGAGNYTVDTGAGADEVTLGGGTSNIDLGDDGDFVVTTVANFNAADTIDGGDGTDTVTFTTDAVGVTDAVFAAKTSIENIALANGGVNQSLTLGANASAAGITSVSGAAENGAQTVTIDATAMTTDVSITGGAGNDVLTGGSGDDVLTGGAGTTAVDILTGGAGADTFVFGGVGDNTSSSTAANLHTIVDFDVTEGDVLDISAFGITEVDLDAGNISNLGAVAGGNLAAALTDGAVTAALAGVGDIAIFTNGGFTYLVIEDGQNPTQFDAGEDFVAKFTSATSDFTGFGDANIIGA